MTLAANNAVCSGKTTGSQLVLFCDKKYILSVRVIHRSNPVTRKNINVKIAQKYLFLNQTTFFLVIVFLASWKNIPNQLLMYLKRNNNGSLLCAGWKCQFCLLHHCITPKSKKINQNTCFSQDENCFVRKCI